METSHHPDAFHSMDVLTGEYLLEQQLRAVQSVAHVGVWLLRLPSNQLSWSDESCHIIGIDRTNSHADTTAYLSAVHPDDRQAVVDVIAQAGEKQLSFNLDHRIVRADGEVRYLHLEGQVLRDNAGHALVAGTMQDVTDRKQSRLALRMLSDRLVNALESMADAFTMLDNDADRFNLADRRPPIEVLGNVIWKEFKEPVGMTSNRLLSLVVPFYNEEDMIDVFFPRVFAALAPIEGLSVEIVCVNDGSRDDTLNKLIATAEKDERIKVIDLSRNFGKEAALTAGLDEASCDVIIPFDADLQDPPEVIPQLVEKWREGYEVVVAKRADRATDTLLKRKSASAFYRVHNKLSDVKIPENVGDFRLMSREVVDALKALPESRRFMKGLFAWVGHRTAEVTYTRESRPAGTTKFSGWKLWNLALEGLTSFSTLPLRVWFYVGFAISALSLTYAGYIVLRTLVQGIDVPGYASLFTSILFFSGVQLMGIGIVGEYIGRIYVESKRRPVYLVRARYGRRKR